MATLLGSLKTFLTLSVSKRSTLTDTLSSETGASGVDESLVETLIAEGASVNYRRKPDGWRPLHLAVDSGQFHLVDCLLRLGADPTFTTKLGYNAMHLATQREDCTPYVVQTLYEHGCSVNKSAIEDAHWTPLHYAVSVGNAAVLEMLLLLRANPNVVDDNDHSPLHLAIHFEHWDMAEALLNCGADPMINDPCSEATLLHDVVARGPDKIVQTLIKHGASGQERSQSRGFLPIHMVAVQMSITKAQILINNGASVNAQCIERGSTLLCMAAASGSMEMVDFLLENGADINLTDRQALSALSHAVLFNQEKIVNKLLAHGASLNSCERVDNLCDGHSDHSSSVPLHIALHLGLSPMSWDFIRRGANTKLRDLTGHIALSYVTLCNAHLEGYQERSILNALLAQGALIEDEYGPRTQNAPYRDAPLITAIQGGFEKEDIVKLLLAHGANPSSPEKYKYKDIFRYVGLYIRNSFGQVPNTLDSVIEYFGPSKSLVTLFLRCGFNHCSLKIQMIRRSRRSPVLSRAGFLDTRGYPDWLEEEMNAQPTLKELTRQKIRQLLKEHFRQTSIAPGIFQLSVPIQMKRFLLMRDFGVPLRELEFFFSKVQDDKAKTWTELMNELVDQEGTSSHLIS